MADYTYYQYVDENDDVVSGDGLDISINSSIVAVPEGGPEVEPESESPYPEGEAEPEGYAEPEVPMDRDHHGRAAYSSLAGMIGMGIIILNIITLLALARKPRQRKTLTYLIGLISAFDLLGGLQFVWFSSLDVQLKLTHHDYWIMVMCGIWMISMTPQITGLLHFGLHWYALHETDRIRPYLPFPIWLTELRVGVGNAKVSSGRIIFIILTAICLPVILLIPPLAGWHCVFCTDLEYCPIKCSNAIFPFPRIYVIILIALLLAAMALVTSVYIALAARMRNKKKAQGYVDKKSYDKKLFGTVVLLLVVYIIFTLPVSIVLIFDYVTINNAENREKVGTIITSFQATMFVSFLSNFINPFIYFTRIRPMREALLGVKREEDYPEGKNMNGYSNGGATNDEEKSNAEEATKI